MRVPRKPCLDVQVGGTKVFPEEDDNEELETVLRERTVQFRTGADKKIDEEEVGSCSSVQMDEIEDDDHLEEQGFAAGIPLEPFAHQVGGHAALHLLDKNTVCKPLIARELRFYQNAPKELRLFRAEYKGRIEVSYFTEPSGTIRYFAHNNPGLNGRLRFRSASYDQKQLRRLRHGSGSSTGEDFIQEDMDDGESGSDENSASEQPTHSRRKRPSLAKKCLTHSLDQKKRYGLDSWNQHLQEKQLTQLRQTSTDNRQITEFLLLENVCGKFVQPCILDLKMGTRQHGDDAPKDKMDRQMEKCAKTTSKALGVRACGMQVYLPNEDRYAIWDKYYGRKLDIKGFQNEALRQFLWNGSCYRIELIPGIIERLRELHRVISALEGYRFYSSSLLIMYEGQANEPENAQENPTELIDVKMIDFAHTALPNVPSNGTTSPAHNGSSSTSHGGADAGYLFGLENLIRLLEELSVPVTPA